MDNANKKIHQYKEICDKKCFSDSVVERFKKFFDNRISDPRLWTVRELAVILNAKEKTIRDWIYKGLIPVVRLVRGVRFNPIDIAEWLAERSN